MAILITVASTTVAMGCGCSSERVRVAPIREQIVSNTCMPQPAVTCQPIAATKRTVYVPESSSCYWVPPSTTTPGYVIGNFFTAPFRWITGRSLGQPDIVSSHRYSELSTARVTTMTTKRISSPCGLKEITHKSTMLAPVGERITDVKVIKTTPMLQPVCEQMPTIHRVEVKTVLKPVAERTIIQTTRIMPEAPLCDY